MAKSARAPATTDSKSLAEKLRTAVNHRVIIVGKDGTRFHGRLNNFGKSAVSKGNFVILDIGVIKTMDVEEVKDVGVVV